MTERQSVSERSPDGRDLPQRLKDVDKDKFREKEGGQEAGETEGRDTESERQEGEVRAGGGKHH